MFLSTTRAGRTAGGGTDVKWRKDTTLRVGPLRVQIMGNRDGICECLVIYDGAHKLVGSHTLVPEEVLDQLAADAEKYGLLP